MAKVLITEDYLSDIGDAIRGKLGGSTQYTPGQMASAINSIPTVAPTLISKSVVANGTYNASSDEADGYSDVTVNVPNTYTESDNGKVVVNQALTAQTSKSINTNGTHDTTANNSVVVDVPNSYAAADEGKVVDNGALVSQGSLTIRQNGTYITTLKNEIIVDVSGESPADDWMSLKDYIESSGTQWINTGYYVQDNSEFELIAEFPQSNAQFATAFGVRATSGDAPSTASCLLFARYNANKIVANFGSNAVALVNNSDFYEQKARYKLKKSNVSGETIDTILGSYTNSSASATSAYQLEIFGLNQGGSNYGSATNCTMKLYRFRIYEGDTLVHEFIPWEDGNNVVCLKDTVTDYLKYNAGTGTFTYGTDE